MEFLFANYPPVKTSCKTFTDAFYELIPQSTAINIAVGYVSSDALVELQKTVELNDNIKELNLMIGMHYFDRFTKVQYNTATSLNEFLHDNKLGGIHLCTAFRYHGKLYSYSNASGAFAGIIGSNNLSGIVDGGTRVYESSILIDQPLYAKQMRDFIDDIRQKAAKPLETLDIDAFNDENQLLEGHEYVEKVSPQTIAEIIAECTTVSFDIPIKPAEVSPQSNLNVFFGKGRESKNGLVKPRHWYEVELIVPKHITDRQGYPQSQTDGSVFTVITDDGWQFNCKVSGDYSKNFRSEGDLKILGKWLKGRLENAAALKVGERVTNDTLREYGRTTFTLTKTTRPGLWYLDFGVKK